MGDGITDRRRWPWTAAGALPRGTVPVGTGLVVLGLTSYVFLVLAARALDPAGYSLIAVLWALTFLAGPGVFVPVEQEVARAVAFRSAHGIGSRPVVRRVGIAVVAGTGAAGAVLALVAGRPFADALLPDAVLLGALLVSFAGFGAEHLLRGALAGKGRFGAYGLVLAVEGLGRIVPAAVLAVVGVGAVGWWGWALCLAPLTAAAVVASGQRELLEEGPPAPWRELSGALFSLLAASVLSQVLVNAGPVLVRLFAAPSEREVSGHFLNALLVARAPLFLFTAVQAAILPALSRLVAAGRLEEFRSSIVRLALALSAVAVAMAAFTLVLGPPAARILFDDPAPLPAADFAYLAAGSGGFMVAMALSQALVALGAFSRLLLGWGVGTAVFLTVAAVLDGLLAPVEIGYLAGALAAAATMGLGLAGRLRQPVPVAGPADHAGAVLTAPGATRSPS